jgi:hypothetical protein
MYGRAGTPDGAGTQQGAKQGLGDQILEIPATA